MINFRLYMRALRNISSDGINGLSLGAVALLVLKVAGIATCSWTVVFSCWVSLFVIENVRCRL